MNKRLLAGILAGIATGAVATLLVSSKKGRRIRKKLMKEGTQMAGQLKQQFSDFVDNTQTRLHSMGKK